MSIRRSSYPKLLLVLMLLLPVPALALPTLSILSSGGGGFVIRGVGLEGVSGLELSISYDPATLSNPRVSLGSMVAGMFNAVNAGSNPLRIIIVGGSRTVAASGIIATISFDRSGASPGSITALSGRLIDLDGRYLAMAQPVIIDSPAPAPPEERGSTGASGSGGAGGDGGAAGRGTLTQVTVGGTLTLAANESPGGAAGETPAVPIEPPGEGELQGQEPQGRTEPQGQTPEQQGVVEDIPVEGEPAGAPAGDGTASPETGPPQAPEAGEAAPPSAPPQGGTVLERFRLFEGERTVESLSALFKGSGAASFTQSPPIAIADGKTTIRLTVSQVAGESAPRFSFASARFAALARAGEGEWELELIPDQGALKASVVVLTDGSRLELPLTVAPQTDVDLDRSGGVSEADFRLFLKERGTPERPRFDLNGDGRRDYQDDYIFTANYLLQMEGEGGKKRGAGQKPQ